MQGFVLGICASQLFIPPAPCGYVAGGFTSTFTARVDKFRYIDDVRSTLAVGLSSARVALVGFASSSAGYAAGGGSANNVTTVDRFAFADDSRTTLASGLSAARNGSGAFASSTAGYVAGGTLNNTLISNIVDKFAFADDSRSTLAVGLASNRTRLAGFSSSSHGYAIGGYASEGGTSWDWVGSSGASKFAFSNDSRTTMTWVANGRGEHCSFASSTAGYGAGGRIVPGVLVNTVTKVTFTTDAYANLATGLSAARRTMAGYASDVAGYTAGGFETNSVTTVDKFAFVDDSRTTLAVGLGAATSSPAGFGAPP